MCFKVVIPAAQTEEEEADGGFGAGGVQEEKFIQNPTRARRFKAKRDQHAAKSRNTSHYETHMEEEEEEEEEEFTENLNRTRARRDS